MFNWTVIFGCTLGLAACATVHSRPESNFANIGYASWTEMEPSYRLYPGDIVDISALTAPELNRTVTVQPDGRISLPLINPVMVADRSTLEAEAIISAAYGPILIKPQIQVAVRTATPLKVFVGGEVDRPGVYDMPGDINALQAIVMAGGMKTTAKIQKVVIIRRGPDGRAMMRTVDMGRVTSDPELHDAIALRRFDVIYVPRSNVAEAGLFVQQYFRNLLPIQFSYALNSKLYGTTTP